MPANRGRISDVVPGFAVLCALVWGVGAFRLSADMPALDPSREALCHAFARPGDVAAAAVPLPPEIGPLAQYGRPYWGTWMPPFTPVEPAGRDPYPACMQREDALALAAARFEARWTAWRARQAPLAQIWAAAPLAGLPLLLLVGPALGLLRRRRAAPPPARQGAGASPPVQASRPALPGPAPVGAGLRRSAATAARR